MWNNNLFFFLEWVNNDSLALWKSQCCEQKVIKVCFCQWIKKSTVIQFQNPGLFLLVLLLHVDFTLLFFFTWLVKIKAALQSDLSNVRLVWIISTIKDYAWEMMLYFNYEVDDPTLALLFYTLLEMYVYPIPAP